MYKNSQFTLQDLLSAMQRPTPDIILLIAESIRLGCQLRTIYDITAIDMWFLQQIKDLIDAEYALKSLSLADMDAHIMTSMKRKGFSDAMLANILNSTEKNVFTHRHQLEVLPVYKRVDSCAAEFPTSTAYMYSTYDIACECYATKNKKVIILGSGPNRIGQGIEFDFGCTHAALALKDHGYEVIMVNSNPETVSTDYDVSDRLYFEPLTLEYVLEIVRVENPWGVIVQFGGQTPLKLANDLHNHGVKLLGSSMKSINITEDRILFQAFIKKLGIPGFQSFIFTSTKNAKEANLDFPVIIRPSYVIGGSRMKVIYNQIELEQYLIVQTLEPLIKLLSTITAVVI